MISFSIPHAERADMLQRFLITQFIGFSFAIALCTVADRAPYLFSEIILCSCVALLIWFFVDVGDFVLFSNNGNRFPFTKTRLIFAAFAVFLGQVIGESICYLFLDFGQVREQFNAIFVWFIIDFMVMFGFIWIITQKQFRDKEKQQTAEVRLKLLESQLQPHMVFNTLANLRALVSTNPVLATEMLDHYVGYLRATVNGSRIDLHSLRSEFDRLGDYLSLMKVRMGSRLEYALNLPSELADKSIPPFLLQPLVENAIKHGLEPQIVGGTIIVNARLCDNQLIIEVNDTGLGCDIDYINTSNGFGLTQVAQRLATIYGDQGSIHFITTSEFATSVQVKFPCIKQFNN
jgi:hypothetical protein